MIKCVIDWSMKKYVIFLFSIFCISFQGISYSPYAYDSVGVTTKNGKKFIIHEVEAGETLYALSRKYNVDVQSIEDMNSGSITSLKIGQRVLIPSTKVLETTSGTIEHIVKPSETLYSISRQYNVKVDDLKNWNNLAESSISIGQKLVIKESSANASNKQIDQEISGDRKTHTVEQSQTLYSISRIYGVSSDQLIAWNNLESNALNIGQVLIISSASATSQQTASSNSSMLPESKSEVESASKSETDAQQSTGAAAATTVVATTIPEDTEEETIEKPTEKIVQKGMCDIIEDAPDTKKYLAFHNDAPVGTIMQVRNEMNNQSVFVRVVNTIPPTGDNSKVILKISKKAYDRLGAVDSRFPVEISYIP